jgi:Fic family protein
MGRFKYVDTFIINMFVEIRKTGKNKKYYLIHSYRVGDKIKRITRYLGTNLSEKELTKLRNRAEQLIVSQAKEKSIFEFELSKKQIEELRRFGKNIKISHLNNLNWQVFTENFTYNTNAIEGSTVTLGEVRKLVEKKDLPDNNDELETLGVAKAILYTKTTKDKLSLSLIKKLHFLCFEKTKSFAGNLREVEVVIRDRYGQIVHQGAPSEKVENLLKKMCDWYEKHKNKYPPLLLASLVHNEFENIHPFRDGNGRVGRLLLNYVLLKHRYPPINIRFSDRKIYYKTLQIFQKKGRIEPTLRFLISQYKKQYK